MKLNYFDILNNSFENNQKEFSREEKIGYGLDYIHARSKNGEIHSSIIMGEDLNTFKANYGNISEAIKNSKFKFEDNDRSFSADENFIKPYMLISGMTLKSTGQKYSSLVFYNKNENDEPTQLIGFVGGKLNRLGDFVLDTFNLDRGDFFAYFEGERNFNDKIISDLNISDFETDSFDMNCDGC